jgi:hypothetical protein
MLNLQWISNKIEPAPFLKILHERGKVAGERPEIIVPKYHQVPGRPSQGLACGFASLSGNEQWVGSTNVRHNTSTVSFN